MSSATQSILSSCLSWTLPCWFSDIPTQKKLSDKIQGDWAIIEVNKKKFSSTSTQKAECKLEKHFYCMQVSTGDLYSYGTGEKLEGCYSKKYPAHETKRIVSFKFFFISIGVIPYIGGVMIANVLRIAYDISLVVKSIFSEILHLFKGSKSFFSSIANSAIAVVWKAPFVIIEDIWRVVCCPLYGVGMLLASVYGIVVPLEGKKWFSEIEGKLHNHAVAFQANGNDNITKQFANKVSWDRPLYLAWCMQKRGNIHEKVHGINKFEYISSKA